MVKHDIFGPEGYRAPLLILLISACILCQPAAALMNPAAVYCGGLGYQYETKTTADGVTGYCILPNAQEVEAWQFLTGTAGAQYSYCARQGLTQKTVTVKEHCAGIFSSRCAVCISSDGSDVEVTRLMNLSFKEPDLKIEKGPVGKTGTQPAVPFLAIIVAAVLLMGIAVGLFFVWKKRTA